MTVQTFISRGMGTVFVPNTQTKALLAARPNGTPLFEKRALNKLIGGLVSGGIWSGLDRLFFTNASDPANALLDAVHPTGPQAIAVNAPTHVPRKGYTGNGVDSRLRANFTPNTDGVNFTQNNASLGLFVVTAVNNNGVDIGGSSTIAAQINSSNGAGSAVYYINDSTPQAIAVATSVGFTMAQRTASNARRLLKNGVQIASGVIASTGVADAEAWICGANSGSFSTKQIALAFWGASLSGKEALFNTLVQTYMTDMGTI